MMRVVGECPGLIIRVEKHSLRKKGWYLLTLIIAQPGSLLKPSETRVPFGRL
jgi:hypothetical protein